MHGLVFVTWEKYLAERFQGTILNEYREALGLLSAPPLLVHRVYDDAALLAGVAAAHRITHVPVDTLLREYGHYFITNGLTRHLCAYLLSQARDGRTLLLMMHDAHEQMTRIPDGLTPPLFQYRRHPSDPSALIIIYDSPRKLCPLLWGAIEGAGAYFGEMVQIAETRCMRRGDKVCEFEVKFQATSGQPLDSAEQREHYRAQYQYAQSLLMLLPYKGGVTLAELQEILKKNGISEDQRRPARLIQALNHLHHAGLVATTANQPGDDFATRRYWRVPTKDSYT